MILKIEENRIAQETFKATCAKLERKLKFPTLRGRDYGLDGDDWIYIYYLYFRKGWMVWRCYYTEVPVACINVHRTFMLKGWINDMTRGRGTIF